MKQFYRMAALICFGMAAIKFCTARMKPNSDASVPPKDDTLSPEEAKVRMEENPSVILLDVRTQEEYAAGHIPGAVCLPVDMITEGMPFPFAKDAEIMVYCHSGQRSTKAAQALCTLGFSNISDLGGITSWPYGTTTE